MTEESQPALRKGREGGRWVNERPTPEEFATWFQASMKLDAALKHEDYIGGVVLIPGTDNNVPHVVGFNQQGAPIIEKREELSYKPYAQVQARIDYFWDLLDAHPEWVAEVEHVRSPRMPIDFITEEEVRGEEASFKRRQPGALTILVHQLPDGFSIMSVPVGEGYSHFLCATTRVSIFKADENGEPKGRPLRTGRGTKQVPLLIGRSTPWADPSSMMKAETGAFGRALGFAGIFVIPGSGVATAEDMLEAIAQGATPSEPIPGNQGPTAPDQAPVRTGAEQAQDEEGELRTRAVTLYRALESDAKPKADEFTQWAHERHLQSLSDARGAMLRGVVRKLERLTDEAEHQEASDVPAQAPAEPSGSPS